MKLFKSYAVNIADALEKDVDSDEKDNSPVPDEIDSATEYQNPGDYFLRHGMKSEFLCEVKLFIGGPLRFENFCYTD